MDEFEQRLNDGWIFDGTVKDIETLWLESRSKWYPETFVDRDGNSALIPPSDAADQSMTLSDLRAICGDGTGDVGLRINRESTNGYSIRLLPRSGPRGIVMCCRDGKTVARFSAKALLRWIDRMEGKA